MMPTDISSMYARILNELRTSDDWLIVERVLTLVSYSARPVSLAEVIEFAVLEDEMTTIHAEERFEDFAEILSLISSLINVQHGILTLAHKSVQDFMVTLQGLGEYAEPSMSNNLLYRGADSYIAGRCLQYLAFPQQPACDIIEDRSVKDPNSRHLAKLLAEYPFLDYAASRWPHHIQNKDLQQELVEQMRLTLPFRVKSNLWKAWLMLQRVDIWETQVQLARLLCEAVVRSALVPSWTNDFWETRQGYRVTKLTKKPGHAVLDGLSMERRASVPTQPRGFMSDFKTALKKVQGPAEAHAAPTKLKDGTLSKVSTSSGIDADFYVKALYTMEVLSEDDLPFRTGDLILVVEKQSAHRWRGTAHGRTGFFAADLVERYHGNPAGQLSGIRYYDLAVTLLEVALQRSLSADLNQLLANAPSENGLKALLGRLEVLISQAAKVLGNAYGSIVREALSNVKYGQKSHINELYEMQDYAMEKLHLPLQHMLESGFRASRSPVSTQKGHLTRTGWNTNGAAPPQSFNVPRPPHSMPAVPMYGVSQTEYQAARFTSVPPTEATGRAMTYEYLTQHSTTAISHSEITRPSAYSHEDTVAGSGISSMLAMSQAVVKHEVTTSVLNTVIEAPNGASSQRDDLSTAGQSQEKDQPEEHLPPLSVLLELLSLQDLFPNVPPSDEKRLAILEEEREAVLLSMIQKCRSSGQKGRKLVS